MPEITASTLRLLAMVIGAGLLAFFIIGVAVLIGLPVMQRLRDVFRG